MVRYCVLISAIATFVLSAALLYAGRRSTHTPFTSWYCLALLLLAVGLFGVMIQLSLWSVVNWLARAAQWLGGFYLLLASLAAFHESGRPLLPSGQKSHPAFHRDFVAVVIVIAAAALRLVFLSALGTQAPFLVFYPAVVFAALYGGRRAGLLATALSAILTDYFWIEPTGQFALSRPADWLGLMLFLLSGTMIAWGTEAILLAQARASAAEAQALLAAQREAAATAVQESRAKLEAAFASMTEAVFIADPDGRLTECSRTIADCPTYLDAYLEDGTLAPPEMWAMPRALRGEEAANVVYQLRRKDTGETWWGSYSFGPIRDPDGGLVGAVVAAREITERKRQEEALRCAKEEWERTFDSVPDLIAILDDQHRVVRANRAMAQRLGITPEQCVGLPCYKAVHGTDSPPDFCPHAQTLRDGWQHSTEVHEDRLGGDFLVSTTPMFSSEGKMTGSVHVARDITEQKLAERERHTAMEFLSLVNEARGTAGLVHAAVNFFHQWSGCQAVGIRIKDGDDYPYFESRGFPEEFVRMENSLCARDATGELLRDSAGYPIQECMCGNVIQGRFDPSKPFFTAWGSFWSNSTTELLASTSEADRQARTRNRCNGEEYESVALIALRVGEEHLGLLQLNDKRKNRFTPGFIALWERLADYLAVALAKTRAQEELRLAKEQLDLRVRERTAELTRALQALRQTGAYTRSLIEASLDPLVTIGPDGTITDVNAATEASTGRTRQELVGTDFSMYFTDPDEARTGYRRVFQEGVVRDYPLEICHRDGHTIPVLYNAAVYRDDGGQVVGIFAAARDITQRKRAEEALRTSEQEFRSLAEAVPQVVWATRADGWNIYFNQRWVDYTGMTMEQSYGHGWNTPFHPDDKQRAWNAWQRATQYSEPYSLECRLRRADGVYRWWLVRGAPMLGANGEILKWFGTCTDIEDLKIAEAALREANDLLERRVADRTMALRESEERFRTLANTIPQLAWWANADGYITWYNDNWYRYTGTTPQQMEGWGWQSVHDPAALPLVMERWKASIATGEPFDMTFPLRGADGVFRRFLTRIQPLKDPAGHVMQWFGTNTDVEELEGAQESLRTAVQDLERSNKELEQFAYVASHDLQEPLRMVSGFMDLLQQRYGPQLDDKAREYIGYSTDAAIRMRQLVKDLLEFSRVGRKHQDVRPVEVRAIVAGVLANLSAVVQEAGAVVTQDQLPTILANPIELGQLFQNLIGNALKFRRPDRPCRIHVGAERQGSSWQFSVRDNGIGIPADSIERVFKIFERLHTREKYAGTGIGLAICKKIIESHGGQIWVESTPGEGSTFHFTLPEAGS
ncbi:MAG: PAS domain S-box protein [Planctomycetota bacterium]|nr:PAS domain S-box protein [Planctomycetota bacterium]